MIVFPFFLAFLTSLIVCMLVIRYQHVHSRYSMDHDLDGVQKFHVRPTPRIGGVPVFAGLLLAMLAFGLMVEFSFLMLLFVSALPVFFAGLLEDLTKRVSPRVRLLAAFVSAGLAAWLVQAVLGRLGVPGVDTLLQAWPLLALLLTMFAVGGVCHATNIIDGYNGLMAGVSIVSAMAFAYVSYKLNDVHLLVLSISLAGALLGFLVWNFPRGLIFAGDAGAYLVGFLLAELAVLLVLRHPQVSPWFCMLVLIYPIFETVFTIYRRRLRNAAAGLPDSMHFHQLIYKRLVRWMVGRRESAHLLKRNSLTAPYLWVMAALTVAPAILFWQYEPLLQLSALCFVALYVWLYKRIVKFRAPRWMVYRKAALPRGGRRLK